MGGRRYSTEELHFLRSSPLVQKPDALPAIEQWMDLPAWADQNNNGNTGNNNATTNNNNSNRRPRSGVLKDGDVSSGEHRTDKPVLINSGMGHFGRRASQQPEDTVLGPPKLAFTSASRTAKAAEQTEKRANALEGDQLSDRFPTRGERWKRDRDEDRTIRDKASYTNGRRAPREEGEGWTNVKNRKSLGQEDFDRGFGRNGDREKDRHAKDNEADHADVSARRLGAGREKFERWGRRDDTVKEGEGNRLGPAGQGGWRDRERDRDRDREKDRNWTRGGNGKAEADPEWMDTLVEPEKKQAKTQEDFQRWKELMKAKDTPAEEKEDMKTEDPLALEQPLPSFFSAAPQPKLTTPMGTEIPPSMMFGNWGKEKVSDAAVPEAAPRAKPKAKSKFANMFTKAEESAPLDQIAPTPASPGPNPNSGRDEDKEGFQRILQMLGGTSISATPGPPPGMPMLNNGARGGGVMLDLHQQQHPDSPPEVAPLRTQHIPRTLEQQHMLENILAPRPSVPDGRPPQQRFNTMSPEASLLEQFGLPRPDSNRPADDHPVQQPPSRNNGPQDAHLHAILSSRAREDAARDRNKQSERDFLLQLMQQPSRGTPPQPNLPRPAPDNQNLPPFFDHAPQRAQGQPKNRGLPPGFMEDPRMFAENERMRREAELREAQLREAGMAGLREFNLQQQQEAMRKNQRQPIGHFPDDPAMLQRRNTGSEIPRQMTNMGIPSQHVPDLPFMRNPGMPPNSTDRNIPPPPGFPTGMRQPPGFGPQGGPQQMGPSFSAGNTPLGHPPGIPGGRGMGGMFQGPGQNVMPPQGPPQGYPFPPPGYGPPMAGLRGGEDPRMMMRPEFEQFGGPGQPGGPRQAGRPPNMY